MPNIIRILFLILYGCAVCLAQTDYGVMFIGNEVGVSQRTALKLDEGNDFVFGENFRIEFKINFRDIDSYGSIVNIEKDDSTTIRVLALYGDDRRVVPAIVFNDKVTSLDIPVIKDSWEPMTISLDRKSDTMTMAYSSREISVNIPLHDWDRFKIIFGLIRNYSRDVAPFNLRDVRIYQDRKEVRHWVLGRHNGNVCIDEHAGAKAVAESEKWLIDNHKNWTPVFHTVYRDKMLSAIDPKTGYLYLVKNDGVEVYDEDFVKKDFYRTDADKHPLDYVNHCFVDTLSRSLVGYSLSSPHFSKFSFRNTRWEPFLGENSEAIYQNHALAYNDSDSSYYVFGGYGIFRYNNNLYRIDPGNGEIEEIQYSPQIPPRFGAAMAIVGDKAYVFGGKGNRAGNQSLQTYHYYDFWEIDLRKRNARQLWTIEDPEQKAMWKGSILASSMYYDKDEDCLYAVNMDIKGGVLYKLRLDKPEITAVSAPIGNSKEYQDFDFKFQYIPGIKKFYLSVDKILADKSHDFTVYSINTPLIKDEDMLQPEEKESSGSVWWIIAGIIVVAGAAAAAIIIIKRRKREFPATQETGCAVPEVSPSPTPSDVVAGDSGALSSKAETSSADNSFSDSVAVQQAEDVVKSDAAPSSGQNKYYDRSRGAVSMLGPFNVRDKEGNDITSKFTLRVKELFLLLILYSEKSTKGIPAKRLTEMLWNDKEDSLARNNRNVTLRKLRVLLEKVGNADIINENGVIRVEWGDVFCDYNEIKRLTKDARLENGMGEEELNRILELLLFGPLLPNTLNEWLDDFKADYSSIAVDLLKGLLHRAEDEGNLKMMVRISDIMFLHDPLSEEALSAKCRALCAQGKKGLAKNLYDRFCKDHKEMLGENYGKSFPDMEK